MENYSNPLRRQLEWWEIQKLQAQECTCDDWQRVRISDRTDLSRIRNVEFKGDIEIGKMLSCNSEIRNAMIDNCRIGDNVRIVNVGVAIRNYEIDNDAEIQNVGLMEYEDEARCGLGVQVNVLDETGSCPVTRFSLPIPTARTAKDAPSSPGHTPPPCTKPRSSSARSRSS